MGFEEQHLALRDRCDALLRKRLAASAVSPSLPPQASPPRGSYRAAKVDDGLGICLVTGGAGFLGAHVVRMLASLEGVESVHVVDTRPPRQPVTSSRVHFHSCSVTDSLALSHLCRCIRPNTIFHVASLIDLRPEAARESEAVNLGGTLTLLALARECGTRTFVYTSSIEVAYHGNTCEAAEEATTCVMPLTRSVRPHAHTPDQLLA